MATTAPAISYSIQREIFAAFLIGKWRIWAIRWRTSHGRSIRCGATATRRAGRGRLRVPMPSAYGKRRADFVSILWRLRGGRFLRASRDWEYGFPPRANITKAATLTR